MKIFCFCFGVDVHDRRHPHLVNDWTDPSFAHLHSDSKIIVEISVHPVSWDERVVLIAETFAHKLSWSSPQFRSPTLWIWSVSPKKVIVGDIFEGRWNGWSTQGNLQSNSGSGSVLAATIFVAHFFEFFQRCRSIKIHSIKNLPQIKQEGRI